ncbi:TetR/AcrR family transcriptional regulator [Actinacidiphila reveromycinica]|uniref:TetR/AcrR family transcriptional regulator n=1 Tax=Actinacidiphila reveromycinica TaxID=659352 RepID=UPI0019232C98|nr:TetR/AcrR family transcriptional regulator [Streptomyces sp. SN-593]
MPSSRPLRADARRNRDALLAAARDAFLAGDGGADAHIEDIARSAGVAVGTLYRHFETREALVEEVYRQEVAELCAAPDTLLERSAPAEALHRFLLLLVEHAAVGKGMAGALAGIMATDSPVFDDARSQMADCLDRLLAAGRASGTLRADADGLTVLRAMGGVCNLRATGAWREDAERITRLLFDGLRYPAAIG